MFMFFFLLIIVITYFKRESLKYKLYLKKKQPKHVHEAGNLHKHKANRWKKIEERKVVCDIMENRQVKDPSVWWWMCFWYSKSCDADHGS